jgi:hypothetical protein
MRLASLLLLLGSLVFLRHALVRPTGTAQAGTALRMDLAALVRGSDLILEGRIDSARAQADERGRIETEYAMSVDRTHLGPHLPARTFRLPGGVLPDGRGLVLAGMPTLAAGERVLLFLSAPSAGGMRMPVGLSQGRLRLVETPDGQLLLARENGALRVVDPRGAPVGALDERAFLDYRTFEAELAKAVAARTRAPAAGN